MSNPTALSIAMAVRRAANADFATASDRELLRRFADADDQPAFAALVDRHTRMVLGVCRRSLATLQDAEDACQATFLLLARKAKSQRWQASITNWLYTTARRVSRNARVTSQRRSKREGKAAVPEAVTPVDRMTGRELLGALDEELAKLAVRYREPLILCYLEGLTRDEAATRLGVPSATLKSQLERGRKRLHDALTARGCTLGAGLLALAVTPPMAGTTSSVKLTESILASASGTPPKAVVELMRGITVNGINKSLLAALVVVSVTALSAAVGTVDLNSTVASPAVPDEPAAEKTQTVAGRVMSPDGEPVAGAKLVLAGVGDEDVELGTSDAEGRFRLELPENRKWVSVSAVADGHGFDFVYLDKVDPTADIELRLVKDSPIRGRIVNTEGKPVSGAKVTVRSVNVYKGGSLDSFLAAWKNRHPQDGLPSGEKHLRNPDVITPTATTDAEGRFTLTGLGAERLVEIYIRGGGMAHTKLWIVNRPGFDPKPLNEATADGMAQMQMMGFNRWLLHEPDFTLIAEQAKTIRGVVRDRDTGKPRVGVKVTLSRGARGRLIDLPFAATTDEQGRYEIRGARKEASYMVEVPSDTETARMAAQVEVNDTDGYAPVTADIAVARGVVVTGRVLDSATGKPVPGQVFLSPLQGNKFVKDYPESGRSSSFYLVKSDDEGRFRIISLPGRVLLMGGVDSSRLPGGYREAQQYLPPVPDPEFPEYFNTEGGHPAYYTPGGAISPVQGNYCKVLTIEKGAEKFEADVLLRRGASRRIMIRDPEGQPLKGTLVAGHSARLHTDPITAAEDSCEVYLTDPKDSRLVVFHHTGRGLVGTLSLTGEDESPTVTLQQPGSVTGRLVGESGEPLSGASVRLGYKARQASELHEATHASKPVTTDEDGRFRMDGLLPGLLFKFRFDRGGHRFEETDESAGWTINGAGKTLEIGEIKLRRQDSN